jgi:hypothetical protein
MKFITKIKNDIESFLTIFLSNIAYIFYVIFLISNWDNYHLPIAIIFALMGFGGLILLLICDYHYIKYEY